jgi:hypothetical protein
MTISSSLSPGQSLDRHDDYRPRNHLNQSVIAMTAMRFSSSLGCNISLATGGRLPEHLPTSGIRTTGHR